MSDANLQPRDDLLRAREELRQRAERALGQGRWRRWRPALDLTLLAAFVVLLTALLAPPVPGVLPIPALDSVAQTTIRAERDVLVEDRKATALRRQESAAGVLPVHDYDSELYFTLGDRVSAAVGKMVRRRDQSEATEVARRTAFESDIGVPIKPGVFPLVEKLEDPLDIAIAVNFFLNMGLDRMIIANRAELPQSGGIESVDLATNRSIRLFYLGGILDLRQFRRLIQARSGDAPYGTARIVRSWIFETAMLLVGANLRANEAATRKLREDAAAEIEPVFVQIKAGEVLVRRGDRVTRSVQERMRWLNESAGGRQRWGETAAMALLLSGVILLAGIFFRRGRVAHDLDRKQILVTLTIVLIAAAFAIAMYYAGRGLAEGLAIPPETATLLIPLALATVLVSLLVDARTSLLVGIGMTILVAYRVDGDIGLVTYYVVGVLVAGIAARGCRRRTDLLRAGLMVALAQMAVLPLTTLLAGESFGPSKLPELGAAAASGLIVAVLALGLLPALEHLFDQPTDMRLLELASSDHPLLKRLALVAPGSYYASVLVGNLSEAAADAIGANGLRARVMALYHDIGKIVRPGYFAENQRDHNEHDRLAPEVSARIILGHVQDGIEIAQRERLGPVVLEAITQHQGTTLLKWFYAKALERAEAAKGEIAEEDFRYPGPKPQSREAGILLLADSVEAATRALGNPAPAEVRARVSDVIAEKVADGQLDECELTFRDLTVVEEAFARTLTLGVYHNRIEYPALPARPKQHGESENEDRGSDRVSNLGDRSA